jgi:hypothetical protein
MKGMNFIKVKDLIRVIVDKVTIYKANGEDFEDIYKGNINSIPAIILEMKVRLIAAKRKGVIDIQVF